MEANSFLTISSESTGLYKEKGSKFLAFAYPVKDETEVKHCLDELRKTYYDARHHCYAYILKPDQSQYRANDDGEPGHSAGDPILGQIRSRNLTNTLVVVVRYFGGTKLGVSGLINAYRSASSDALDKAGKKKVEIKQNVLIQFKYELTSDIMALVNDHTVLNQKFTDSHFLEIEVPSAQLDLLVSKLKILQNMGKSVKFEIKS